MKPAIGLCFLVLMCLNAGADQKITFQHKGKERNYWVHTPPNWNRNVRSPLVMVFHGGSGKATNSENQMGFTHAVDPRGYVLAYMDGIEKAWDDGRHPDRESVDDLGYFDTALAAIEKEFGTDPARVFVSGISNGGGMSFRLACERADKIAGIGVVAMNFAERMSQSCKPSRPVPVLHVMGDDDRLVPFKGGEITGPLGLKKRGKVLSAEATLAFWEKIDGCRGKGIETSWDKQPKDGTKVTRRISAGCSAPVEQILIWGGGHTWPMGKQYLPKILIGRVSKELDGADTVMAFFSDLGKK